MRILIAPDKFKGSLSAQEVADNIAAGIREVLPNAKIEIAPVADGGEGTAETICQALGGEWVTCDAHDALSNEITARYAWLPQPAKAVMEMSEAAGLRRLELVQRDPLHANTFGAGEMLLDAAKRGAREIVIGLGGSLTNDGGFGLARALGFQFFAQERELVNGPVDLIGLTRIQPAMTAGGSPAKPLQSQPAPLPPHVKIIAATDVRNPLLGNRGATRVFGPQKGATPEQIEILERALTNLANTIARDLGCDFRHVPGTGAAGGLGFGLMSFCRARLRAGFEVIVEAIQLEEKIKRADMIITGEGKLDRQTFEGKAPAGVAMLARKCGKRVFAVVGQMDRAIHRSKLFDEISELARSPTDVSEAMKRPAELIRERAAELARKIDRWR